MSAPAGGSLPHLTVSTVIPTYNRAHLLERALRSALPQCEPGDEVLVVDDGSTDGTEALVRRYGPPVRLLRTAHAGAGAARNAGVRAAVGDLVAFLDSDDEWMPGKLALQRVVLAVRPDVLFVFSDFANVGWHGDRRHHFVEYWRQDPRGWDEVLGPGVASETIVGLPDGAPPFRLHVGSLYESLLRHWSVCTNTVVVRRIEAGDALHFAEDLPTYEDLECYARLSGRGLAGFMDCETAWNNNEHRGSRLTDADPLTKAKTALAVIERVWGADAGYLLRHRQEFEAVSDLHRERLLRELLARGRNREARQVATRLFRVRIGLVALTFLPGGVVRRAYEFRRSARARWRELRGGEG